MIGKPTITIYHYDIPDDVLNELIVAENAVLQASGLLSWKIDKEQMNNDNR